MAIDVGKHPFGLFLDGAVTFAEAGEDGADLVVGRVLGAGVDVGHGWRKVLTPDESVVWTGSQDFEFGLGLGRDDDGRAR